MLKTLPAPIHGSDIRRDAIAFAESGARAAGLGHMVTFERKDLVDARPPEGPPGVLICNPPYGERLGEEKDLYGLYRAIGDMARHWSGWKVFVFTSNDRLARGIGLKPKSRTPFFNGKLPCHLWRFDMY